MLIGPTSVVTYHSDDLDFRNVGAEVPDELCNCVCPHVNLSESCAVCRALCGVCQRPVHHVAQHGDNEFVDLGVRVIEEDADDAGFEVLQSL